MEKINEETQRKIMEFGRDYFRIFPSNKSKIKDNNHDKYGFSEDVVLATHKEAFDEKQKKQSHYLLQRNRRRISRIGSPWRGK